MTLQIPKSEQFISKILTDIYDYMIIFVSVRGHGKSSSLRTLLKRLMEKDPDIIIKTFDISQSHYWCSPLKYRQLVTMKKIYSGDIENIGDCVFEMGLLTEEQQKNFISSIIAEDYISRYNFKLKYGEMELKTLPFIIYCIEESNIVFDSYSLKKQDKATEILRKFVSVGRNMNLSAFLCCTKMKGELATAIRERSSIVMGRVNGATELSNISALSTKEHRKLSKMLPKYYFAYSNSDPEPFRIRDEVKRIPINYLRKMKIKQVTPLIEPLRVMTKPRRRINWMRWGLGLPSLLWVLYLVYLTFLSMF